jgi:hypothetical protein
MLVRRRFSCKFYFISHSNSRLEKEIFYLENQIKTPGLFCYFVDVTIGRWSFVRSTVTDFGPCS